MICEWCHSGNIVVVEDGYYLHHICQSCHHEWDESNPNHSFWDDFRSLTKEEAQRVSEYMKQTSTKIKRLY